MSKTFKNCGIAALVAVIGFSFSSCASLKVVDKEVPIDQTAIIHMNKDWAIWSVDGNALGVELGPLSTGTKGRGANRWGSGRISQERVRIPAGERVVEGGPSNSPGAARKLTFTFNAGRHYELVMAVDATQGVGRAVGRAMLTGGYDITFVDITDFVGTRERVPEDLRVQVIRN